MKALTIPSLLAWSRAWFRIDRAPRRDAELDGLDAFASERKAHPSTPAARRPTHRNRWITGALAAVALIEAPAVGLWLYERSHGRPIHSAAAAQPQPQIHLAVPLVVTASTPARVDPAPSPRESAAATATAGGWLTVKTPVPMQVFEGNRLVGTTDVERIMLPVGAHRLEVVSEALGYRSRQDVAIRAGETSTLRMEMPEGALAVNAQPWAEVWIDGERIGETPIGNLPRTIGPHEVVFRHPELGEKKTTVVVTLKEPARVGIDLRSKS